MRVPLYARNRRDAHAQMIRNTNCRLVLVDTDLAEELRGLESDIECLDRIVLRDANYEPWLASLPEHDPDPVISHDDYHIIRHTGGTTGKPKGVAYRHHAWMTICAAFFSVGPRVERGDAVLHVGPLSHASGFMFLPAWHVGARNVMMDAFDPEAFLRIIADEGITHAFVAPTMLNAVINHRASFGRTFPRLKMLLSASAPVSENTIRKSCEVFGANVMHSAYGQTEILPIAGMGPREWFGQITGSTPIRSVGRPLPGADIEIRDEQNRTVEAGASGEIVARFDHAQMEGFWNDPEETRERVVDGWVRTGDLGTIDANGFLYLLDRKTDMIVSGGFNIYPNEIENVIAGHPEVMEVAVFGVPHPKWGETPIAVVRTRPDSNLTAAEVIGMVSGSLGSVNKPADVVFTHDPLPLSNVGKVLRSQLREPYWRENGSRVGGA